MRKSPLKGSGGRPSQDRLRWLADNQRRLGMMANDQGRIRLRDELMLKAAAMYREADAEGLAGFCERFIGTGVGPEEDN